MKTINYIIALLVTISISACSSTPDFNPTIEKELDKSLVMSTYELQNQIKVQFKKVNSLPDSYISYWQSNWQNHALQAEQISDSVSQYIEELKFELKREAKEQTSNGVDVFNIIDKDAVNKIFNTNNKGVELYYKLKKYNADMRNIDSLIANNFQNNFVDVTKNEMTGNDETELDFTKKYFANTSVIETLTLLSYFKNRIAISENKVISFCVSQTISQGGGGCFDRQPSFLLTQSSTYVKPGEQINVKAGLVTYSTATQPVITIGAKTMQVTNDGSAVDTIFAGKPGKYVLPVIISFYDEHGVKLLKTSEVKYEVGK